METLCRNCHHGIPQHKGNFTACWAHGCDCRGFKHPKSISNRFYPCENEECNHGRITHTHSGGACWACECRNYYHKSHNRPNLCEFCHHDNDRHMIINTGVIFTKCLACGCIPRDHRKERKAIEQEKQAEKRREQERREARKQERELERLREQNRKEEIQREIEREKQLAELRKKQWETEREHLSQTNDFVSFNDTQEIPEYISPDIHSYHTQDSHYHQTQVSHEKWKSNDSYGLINYFLIPAIILSLIATFAFDALGVGIIVGAISAVPIWYYYLKNPTISSKNKSLLVIKRALLTVAGLTLWFLIMPTFNPNAEIGIKLYAPTLVVFYIFYLINNKLKF